MFIALLERGLVFHSSIKTGVVLNAWGWGVVLPPVGVSPSAAAFSGLVAVASVCCV